MENSSEEIKQIFEEKFDTVSQEDKKDNKIKVNLLYTACIIAFIFTLTCTTLLIMNYEKAKANSESNVDEIQIVNVKEY